MSKRSTAKFKIDRRMGESIWGRGKSPVNKRSYGPGQHGQHGAKKLSDYGTQLQAKQKLKGYYGNITGPQSANTTPKPRAAQATPPGDTKGVSASLVPAEPSRGSWTSMTLRYCCPLCSLCACIR